MPGIFWVVPIAGIVAILFAIYLANDVLKRDTGTDAMQRIASMIFQGAMAFLNRQYRTIMTLAVIAAVVIGVLIGFWGGETGGATGFDLGWRTGLAFLVGAICSAVSGFVGMYVAVKSNIRTASAARRSLSEAISCAMRGGAVSGFLVVALSLLGVAAIFVSYGGLGTDSIKDAPFLIVGFGFGASFVALFAQLGGGIYTKAADVGSDLVGKVEAGIPEDDPRNAAVIADLVGDNVGDCAGRGADLFESTAAENIGAMILGVAIYTITKRPEWIMFPLVVRAFGLLATIVGILLVRGRENEDPMKTLNRGYYVTCILSVVGMLAGTYFMFGGDAPGGAAWYWFFFSGVMGILTSIAFVYITQYYTAGSWRPVKEIAEASRTGPATNIIAGTAVGFECTASTAITIGIALIASFYFGSQAAATLGISALQGGIFGTAVATMGMLMTCAYILAMDTFGPITDNAGGIAEMSKAPEQARHITDALDAVGNTTKALTKGYAVASAALAAFLLFSAYLEKVGLELAKKGEMPPAVDSVRALLENPAGGATAAPLSANQLSILTSQLPIPVDLAKVEVFVGALLGAMLVYLFSSLAIRAVGQTASMIIEEVRRQFRENPKIMTGEVEPDFARCVDITTKAALRNMVAPGLLAVGMPIVVGLLLKWEAEAALLMVGTIAGIILATVLNNGGGAWDNAKKFIEAGHLKGLDGAVIGKRTPAHAAAVVGDTVGDPFKDTAGPSLHVLIKLLSTITLVLAPLFL